MIFGKKVVYGSKEYVTEFREIEFKGKLYINKIDFVWPRNHISSLKKYLKILDTPCSHK